MAPTSRSSRLASAIEALRQDPDTPTLEQHERRGLPVLLNNSRADISTVAALDRLDQALGLIERFAIPRERVWLMAEGVDSATLRAREAWLAQECLEHRLTLSGRLHIHIFGDSRGT